MTSGTSLGRHRAGKHLGVRFIYEQTAGKAPVSQVAEVELTLEALPADWVADLYQAAIQADADSVLNLIDQIRDQNDSLADSLTNLVHNFRFDIIVNLTQQVGGGSIHN